MSQVDPATDPQVAFKRAAAVRAVEFVQSGMKLGLGTGSTAIYATRRIGEMLGSGELRDIEACATSRRKLAEAIRLGIPMLPDDLPCDLDLTIDGADEVDPELNVIKGGGGALLREKIVATSSRRLVVIADESKRVETLGRFPLPVEVVPFGVRSTARKIDRALEWAGCPGPKTIRVREARPFVTDNGNLIIDCALSRIADPERAAAALSSVPGVVCHGLFLKLAKRAYIGTSDGVSTITV